jgi:two-component system response regulator NreC
LITILLVDDHDLVREGLRALLEREPGFQVVGEAGDGQTAMRRARELHPQVVLMDVSLPGGLGGLEAAEALLAELPATKVLVLTQYDNPEYIRRALRIGAHGYLLKRGAGAQLVEAIRTVAGGGRYLHPVAAAEVVEMLASGRSLAEDELDALTPRERQVIKLLAEGRTSREIAKELGVSLKTAMTHRANLMTKLDLHSRADLIKFAIRRGIIQVEPSG